MLTSIRRGCCTNLGAMLYQSELTRLKKQRRNTREYIECSFAPSTRLNKHPRSKQSLASLMVKFLHISHHMLSTLPPQVQPRAVALKMWLLRELHQHASGTSQKYKSSDLAPDMLRQKLRKTQKCVFLKILHGSCAHWT